MGGQKNQVGDFEGPLDKVDRESIIALASIDVEAFFGSSRTTLVDDC